MTSEHPFQLTVAMPASALPSFRQVFHDELRTAGLKLKGLCPGATIVLDTPVAGVMFVIDREPGEDG